jgi:hypothetical protein
LLGEWMRLMVSKSKRTISTSRSDAKVGVARRRRAIREKYSASVALSGRQKIFEVLKAVLYVLGGPLVWITKSGRNN